MPSVPETAVVYHPEAGGFFQSIRLFRYMHIFKEEAMPRADAFQVKTPVFFIEKRGKSAFI